MSSVAIAWVSNITSLLNGPQINGTSESAKLTWIVRLRWFALSLALVASIPAYHWGILDRASVVIFTGVIALHFIFNLMTSLMLSQSVSRMLICFQLIADVAVLTSLLFVSGGFANPFVALFLLSAAMGGVLIPGRHSWPFILICHGFLTVLQIQKLRQSPYLFGPNSGLELRDELLFYGISQLLLFIVWFVLRSLGSYLENHFEALAQARVALEKRDRLRAIGALAAGFSHEFASPLNAAKLRLDRLERMTRTDGVLLSSPDVVESLEEARRSVQICEGVIRSMNSSQLDVRDHLLKRIKAQDFIRDVTDSWREEHPDARLEVVNSVEESLTVSPINLAQVILNLLDNAYEASPKDPLRLQISIVGERVVLTVEDSGAGFGESVLERKGEPFVTTKHHGTGLGLYVSEIFVQSLGGFMRLENKMSGGAIVTLNWPGHD